MEKEQLEHRLQFNRRRFLKGLGFGIGGMALGSLLIPDLFTSTDKETMPLGLPHFAPKAKRIIYLFQNGAPSQLDLFDYKPLLNKMQGEDLLWWETRMTVLPRISLPLMHFSNKWSVV